MAGITPEGFEILTFDEIKAELEESFRSAFGEQIDLTADSPTGQLIGIEGLREANIWEVLQASYDAMYPSSATGIQLTNIAKLGGVNRKAATATKMTLLVNADLGTSIPTGFLVRSASKTYALIEGFVAEGTDEDTGRFECTETGPFLPDLGNDPDIVNPISGIDSVEYLPEGDSDIDVGADEESDEELRIRRAQTVAGSGTSTKASILRAVLDIEDVDNASIAENDTDVEDDDGVPPHAFEVIVTGGDDDDVAAAIAARKPVGIQAFGTTEVEVNGEAIGFTRPEILELAVEVTVTPIEDVFPGENFVKGAIADAVNALTNGKDVVINRLISATLRVDGVFDVTDLKIAVIPDTPGSSNISVSIREVAKCDVSNVTVTLNAEIEDT